MTGASAAARAIYAARTRAAEPRTLQELHEGAAHADVEASKPTGVDL
jgi:hypothetical protein